MMADNIKLEDEIIKVIPEIKTKERKKATFETITKRLEQIKSGCNAHEA